jgi:hypothetical protein
MTTLSITYRHADMALRTFEHTLSGELTLSQFLYSINQDRKLDLLSSFHDAEGLLEASIPARAILFMEEVIEP